MKHLTLLFSVIILMSSCSETTAPEPKEEVKSKSLQSQIEMVVDHYCTANNEKKAGEIPDLLYPELFSTLDKKEVEYMFYAQLNTTKKFEITQLQFEGPAIKLDGAGEHTVYSQKYSSKISLEMDPLAVQGFENLVKAAEAADKNAKIDLENYKIDYKEKRKLMMVEADGAVYILPDVFLSVLKEPKFDVKMVLASYKAIP